MALPDDELGRFSPKKKPREPREPFLPDEMLEPTHEPETPQVKNLHVPIAPLNQAKLTAFLAELEPIVHEIQHISRKDQHVVATRLQEVKNLIHAGEFEDKVVETFDEIVTHFNELLIHSTPVDQEAVLLAIHNIR